MTRPNDIETRLRATLAERAREAPPGDPLADRILAEVDAPTPVLRPRHGWRSWTFPLLAAAAVAAVVITVVGLNRHGDTASPAHQQTMSPLPKTAPVTPTPPSTPTTTPTAPQRDSGGVVGFRALDVTFVSDTDGWALGSATCPNGTARCTAVFRTTDGHTWTSTGGADFNVPGVKNCAAPCVEHLRFANDSVGYAFSATAFFMTTDGGAHWARQPGSGALAVESHGGTVVRLVSSGSGCPGPCNLRAQSAPIGTTQWTSTPLQPDGGFIANALMTRAGDDVYVLVLRNPAGGGSTETSTLFVSRDAGSTWTKRPSEPCPQRGGEVDSVAVAAAPHAVTVLCERRLGGHPVQLATSSDAGATFHDGTGTLPANASVVSLVGDPGTQVIAYGDNGAYRSIDAGRSWQRVAQLSGPVSFLGFESTTVGRAVTNGGRTVWTTHDGGRNWSPVEFASR